MNQKLSTLKRRLLFAKRLQTQSRLFKNLLLKHQFLFAKRAGEIGMFHKRFTTNEVRFVRLVTSEIDQVNLLRALHEQRRLQGVGSTEDNHRRRVPYSFIPPLLSSFQILRHTLQSHLIPHSSPSHFIVCSPSNRPFLHKQVLKSCKNPRDGVESTNPTVSIAIFPRYTLPSTRTPPPC
ncbi:hypothetical protein L2E82_41586 [Cichorium intybus]|uniref:Uncharacterized protein n=1 Tax=Cichorium intybus TaxID=13427 RepID=A0ACB9ASQ3_CICIN|nr:hypothetical protein L2E82_41586 [Cichorium intybus]